MTIYVGWAAQHKSEPYPRGGGGGVFPGEQFPRRKSYDRMVVQ